MKRAVSFFVAVSCVASATSAKELAVEPAQRYLLLETTKTSTMQKELTEAAGKGFRVVVGGATGGADLGTLMERLATPPDVYEYRLLATSKAATMQKEMNEAGAAGFKAIPTTIVFKQQLMGDAELVLLMERAPKSTKRYQYTLFSAIGREAQIRDKLAAAVDGGYVVVGLAMTSWAGAQVIVEKESEAGGVAK